MRSSRQEDGGGDRRSTGRLSVVSHYGSNGSTHDVGVQRLHVDVPYGAAGQSPHLGFVFERRPDLQGETERHEDKRRPRARLQRQSNFFFFYLRVEKTMEKENKKSLRKKKKILEKIFFFAFSDARSQDDAPATS